MLLSNKFFGSDAERVKGKLSCKSEIFIMQNKATNCKTIWCIFTCNGPGFSDLFINLEMSHQDCLIPIKSSFFSCS